MHFAPVLLVALQLVALIGWLLWESNDSAGADTSPRTLLTLYGTVVLCALALPEPSAKETLIVAATGAAVIWTTWETAQLRRAALRQLELQTRAVVVVEPNAKRVKLHNLGPSPALNVRVLPVLIEKWDEAPDLDARLELRFHGSISVLPVGSQRELDVVTYLNGQELGDFFGAHIEPAFATQAVRLIVEYQSVDMTVYRLVHVVSPGELGIAEFSGGPQR